MGKTTSRRIGIYGGTFNPVHFGHIRALTAFRECLALDLVLVIPACIPPHKQGPEDISPADRLAMTRLALKEIPGCIVSDLEIRRGGPSYTIDTLRELKGLYPEDELFFLTGTDMFLTIDQWREGEKILQLCTVCTAPRHEQDLPALSAHARYLYRAYGAKTQIIPLAVLDIASTTLREMAAAGADLSPYVPASVIRYIKDHQLYR